MLKKSGILCIVLFLSGFNLFAAVSFINNNLDEKITTIVPGYNNQFSVINVNSNGDSWYRTLLERQLADAKNGLANAEAAYTWAVDHNTGVLIAFQRVLMAQRHVQECEQRLLEWQ